MRTYLLVMVIAAAVTFITTPIARQLARYTHAITPVRERDVHTTPVPRLGGLAMLTGLAVSLLVASRIPFLTPVFSETREAAGLLVAAVGVTALGVADDLWDLDWWAKLGGQVLAGLVLAWSGVLLVTFPIAGLTIGSTRLSVIATVFVVVTTVNAVNFVDGLDGLAIVPVMVAAAAFGIIAYLAGNAVFADYLQIHFTPGTGELSVVLGALIGAGLGFLWFNAPPAAIFMGDTGSLALGGLIGSVAVATKHEIVLAIIGGLFVVEIMSVIIQVAWFKLTGKRVFLMAPIHHHFEKLGWTESQVVIRFWIIAVVLALIGLSTLKLR